MKNAIFTILLHVCNHIPMLKPPFHKKKKKHKQKLNRIVLVFSQGFTFILTDSCKFDIHFQRNTDKAIILVKDKNQVAHRKCHSK